MKLNMFAKCLLTGFVMAASACVLTIAGIPCDSFGLTLIGISFFLLIGGEDSQQEDPAETGKVSRLEGMAGMKTRTLRRIKPRIKRNRKVSADHQGAYLCSGRNSEWTQHCTGATPGEAYQKWVERMEQHGGVYR